MARWQFGTPRAGELHLRPFMLPSTSCDADHPSVVELSQELTAEADSVAAAAASIRSWVRRNIVYTLQDKSDTASQTLSKLEGMCTNKANLQIALLRAAGIPAGYSLVHITKQAFEGPHTLPAVYEPISDITLHCFCSVYIPEADGAEADGAEADGAEADGAEADGAEADGAEADGAAPLSLQRALVAGEFRSYDATEREDGAHLMEHLPQTDETRYRATWLRGPLLPTQACLDHLLQTPFRSRIAPADIEAQNELWRKHRI